MALLKNKPLMLLIAVAGLVLAGLITYKNPPNSKKATGIETIDPDEVVWVKCKSPECAFENAIAKREYFELVQKGFDPMKPGVQAIACNKCGKSQAYRTLKCEKCGEVFYHGESKGFVDKCTKCGFSKTEQSRK